MLALLLLLAGVFYRQLQVLAGKKRVMVIAVLAFALCSFLKVRGEGYTITAALFGVEGMAAVPQSRMLRISCLACGLRNKSRAFHGSFLDLQ